MAKYIFNRLDKGVNRGTADVKHWATVNKYDNNAIKALPDGDKDQVDEGDNGPTSIPSPFARIALVKTAFKEVAEGGATKIYERIVSEALDIAEIFFTFSRWASKIDIIEWKKADGIKQLNDIPQDADNITKEIKKRHRYLSNTYTAFLTSDAQEFNFGSMSSIYILKLKETSKVLGATSPVTLFFPAPDNEKIDDIELSKNHKAFGGVFHLKDRSDDFKNYLCAWCRENQADTYFSEFRNYVRNQVTTHYYDNAVYPTKKELNYKNIYPNVCGKKLYEFEKDKSAIRDNSDFVVKTTVCRDTNPPLILGGMASGIENWKLDKDTKWENRIVDASKNRNILPDGSEYPWLTAEDFLEDKIIQLQKPLEKGYFSGKHTNNAQKSLLLPLKDKFFHYFTVEELKEMVTIDGSSSIRVTLSIPVKNGKVQFVKEYKSENIISLGSETNFMLFPNVKFSDAQSSFYRFGLFREFSEVKTLSAKFFNNSSEIMLNETNDVITRNTKDSLNNICTTYVLEQKEIDRIKILIDHNIGGVIIPNLESKSNTVNFTFAVDFGTTNTHIEYLTNTDGNIKPFDITDQDEQISWFVNPGERVALTRLVADIDFIPEHIGYKNAPNIKVKFPTRTALIVADNATIDSKLPFAHTNIVLAFDKRNVPAYNGVPITQLKWESDIEKVGFYIDNLCYLIRNKIVLNNGNLANAKIFWTYPLSMNTTRLGHVTEKWHIAYKKYFGNNAHENCTNLTESLAPFYHYKNEADYKELIKDLVSIDIGGGTTDVVFVRDSKPNFVTSFRFAANDLFGLGENVSKIITKHQQYIENKISELGSRSSLSQAMISIAQNTRFGDYASFFFSLKENEDLIEKGKSIDFNKMLKEDDNQKLVFLLFFAAIIYHTAQVMKARGLSMPRHLTFSGNGSRIIDVLGKKDMLEKIATLIFEKIFAAKYGDDKQAKKLDIIPNTSNPKEVTCKGTIRTLGEKLPDPSHDVLLGIDNTSFANKQKYSELQKSNTDLIDKINTQVNTFFTYVFDELLKSEIKKQVGTESIEKALSIPKAAIDKAKEVVANKGDMETVVKNKIKFWEEKQDSEVEETLFFFPIPALLRTISREIENKGG